MKKVKTPLLLTLLFLIVCQVNNAQQVTVYTDDFAGSEYNLGVGQYDYFTLVRYGITVVRSVKIPAGMKATLYEKDHFEGSSLALTETVNMRYLQGKGFGQLTQNVSLIITKLPEEEDTKPVKDSKVGAYDYAPPCEPMQDQEYTKAFKAVKSKPFSEDKMAMARLVTKNKCLSNKQIKGIASQFNFEEQALEFVEYAYEHASEKSNYYELESVFKFMSTQEAFAQFLSLKASESPVIKSIQDTSSVTSTTETVVNYADLKKEAMDFSLKLIRTYFTQDCDAYFSYLSPEILTFDRGAVAVTEDLKSELCKRLPMAVNDKSKTMEDYLDAYTVELLSRSAVEAKAGQSLPALFNTTDEEFYFLGYERKQDSISEKFIWEEMFRFLVRKTDGVWKLKAPL